MTSFACLTRTSFCVVLLLAPLRHGDVQQGGPAHDGEIQPPLLHLKIGYTWYSSFYSSLYSSSQASSIHHGWWKLPHRYVPVTTCLFFFSTNVKCGCEGQHADAAVRYCIAIVSIGQVQVTSCRYLWYVWDSHRRDKLKSRTLQP